MLSELSEHKRRVAATYNLASAGYDQEAGRFFPLCANRLVELIGLQPGQRVLDVATGTGAAAIAAARGVGPAGHVVGVDIATDMLEQARRKSMAAQLTNIEFQEGDAEHLSYADRSFDAVTCAFGVFFLPEMAAGPREWKRVVREAGLEQCRSLLQDAGLERIEGRAEQLGYYLRGPQEWWEFVWNSGFRGPISQLALGQVEQFKKEHLAEARQLVTDQGIWLDIAAFFVWGYKF